MSTPRPLMERWDNVVQLTWVDAPPRPPIHGRPAPGMSSGEEATSARRGTYLARCWRRSQLRRDLADAGVVIGIAVAVLICVAIWPDEISRVAYVLLGGAR